MTPPASVHVCNGNGQNSLSQQGVTGAAQQNLGGLMAHAVAGDQSPQVLGRFAGQGFRYCSELWDLHSRSSAVRELYAAISGDLQKSAGLLNAGQVDPVEAFALLKSLVGTSLADPGAFKPLNPESDGVALLRPAISCPMICLAQLANVWQVLHEQSFQDFAGLRAILGAGLAGHSQGVIAAVALASSRNLAEFHTSISVAVTLLWLIGRHVESVEGRMALVTGEGLVRADLDALLEVEPLPGFFIAGRNLEDTFVLAGRADALESFRSRLMDARPTLSFRELHVHAPFHTALLKEVVPLVLEDASKLGLSFGELQMPVFGGGGQLTTSSIQHLVELICTAPLDWPGDMAAAAGSYDFLVDFGPGGRLPLADKQVLRLSAPLAAAPVAPSEGRAKDPRSCIEEKLLAAFGSASVDLDMPFFELGLTSRDLSRLAAAVAEELGSPVEAIDLLDYPTARRLGDCMEQRLGLSEDSALRGATTTVSKKKDAQGGLARPSLWGSVYSSAQIKAQQPDQVPAPWESLGVAEVMALQNAILEATARPEHLSRLAQLAWQCYPDRVQYTLLLEDLQAGLVGPLLLARQLAKNLSALEVRRARAKLQELLLKLSESVPELSEKSLTLARLTLRDPWPTRP
mmetsp:Transcript_30314/g.66326  ORF Transcript_30314/g.66326 Transcript_30314/m.66326 type:complete len:632 (+) Transcript_30314:68-1963(+)